jgi:hypothetical protein
VGLRGKIYKRKMDIPGKLIARILDDVARVKKKMCRSNETTTT